MIQVQDLQINDVYVVGVVAGNVSLSNGGSEDNFYMTACEKSYIKYLS